MPGALVNFKRVSEQQVKFILKNEFSLPPKCLSPLGYFLRLNAQALASFWGCALVGVVA